MNCDKVVNKNFLLNQFLNDINKIECKKRIAKHYGWLNLKSNKSKLFALPKLAKHFNKKFIMQQDDGDKANRYRPEPAKIFYPKKNIYEAEVNIVVENRSIENCVSLTNVHSSTPQNTIDFEKMFNETKVRNILTSTRIDEQHNITCPRPLYIPKKHVSHELQENRRNTIYDYAAKCMAADEGQDAKCTKDGEQYTKLNELLNTNILEKLNSNTFLNTNRCKQILEQINQNRNIISLDRCNQNERNPMFGTATYCVPVKKSSGNMMPSLLCETPSIKLSTININKEFTFELDSIRKQEFLGVKQNFKGFGVKPKLISIRQMQKQIKLSKFTKNNFEINTFFDKTDIEEEFFKMFSLQ